MVFLHLSVYRHSRDQSIGVLVVFMKMQFREPFRDLDLYISAVISTEIYPTYEQFWDDKLTFGSWLCIIFKRILCQMMVSAYSMLQLIGRQEDVSKYKPNRGSTERTVRDKDQLASASPALWMTLSLSSLSLWIRCASDSMMRAFSIVACWRAMVCWELYSSDIS